MSIGGYRASLRLVSPHRWTAILVAVLVTTPAAGAHTTKVRVSVVPRSSSADQPVHIRVAGLHPRSSAQIRLRVSDARGRVWHASALFRGDSRGVVDLDRSTARSGSYVGRWGMGLIASLTTKTPSAYRFRWQAANAQTFRIEVRVRGRRVASRTFRRAMPGAVVEKRVSIADSGFYGSYYTRANIAERAPAILLLGGSEGGLPSGPLVTTLAARGFPTLSLAYFGAPGLPPALANIPLEYFEKGADVVTRPAGSRSHSRCRHWRFARERGGATARSSLPEPRQRGRGFGSEQRFSLRISGLLGPGLDTRGTAGAVHTRVRQSISQR